MHPISRRIGAALAAAAVASLPLLPPGPAEARETGVTVAADFQFQPKNKFVEVGDTVVWTHRDGSTPHTVESTGGESFDSSRNCPQTDILLPEDCMYETRNSTFRHTFNSAGDFGYRCELHDGQGMVGTIHVRPKATAIPTQSRPQTQGSTAPATTTASPTGTAPTGSPTTSGSPGATPTATGSTAVAAPTDDGNSSEDKSSAVGVAIAALSIVVLGGAGYLVWRRFLAT